MLYRCFYYALLSQVCSANGKRFIFYSRSNYAGYLFENDSAELCTNVPSSFGPVHGSIMTDTCLVIYQGPECHWSIAKILPGKIINLAKLNYTTYFEYSAGIQSYHECSEDNGTQLNLDIYNDYDRKGSIVASFTDVCTCRNLLEFDPLTSPLSVDNHGTSMKAYTEENCTGQHTILRAGRSHAADTLAIYVKHNENEEYDEHDSPNGEYVFRPVRSIGADDSSIEFRDHCVVKLDAKIFKFEILETYSKDEPVTMTNVDLAAKTTLRNNGSAKLVQEYTVQRHITEAVEFQLISSLTNLHRLGVESFVNIDGTVSIPFIADAHFQAGLKGLYNFEGTKSVATIQRKLVENKREISIKQQVEVPPCTEYTVHSFVMVVQNKSINYKVYTRITGLMGSDKVTAAQVKENLGKGLDYVEDFDENTVVAVATGNMIAQFGLDSVMNGLEKRIPDCVTALEAARKNAAAAANPPQKMNFTSASTKLYSKLAFLVVFVRCIILLVSRATS